MQSFPYLKTKEPLVVVPDIQMVMTVPVAGGVAFILKAPEELADVV